MCVCVVVIYCSSNFSLIIIDLCCLLPFVLRTLTCNFEEMTAKQLVYVTPFHKSLGGAGLTRVWHDMGTLMKTRIGCLHA